MSTEKTDPSTESSHDSLPLTGSVKDPTEGTTGTTAADEQAAPKMSPSRTHFQTRFAEILGEMLKADGVDLNEPHAVRNVSVALLRLGFGVSLGRGASLGTLERSAHKALSAETRDRLVGAPVIAIVPPAGIALNDSYAEPDAE